MARMGDLPEVMLIEILIRLPVISLLIGKHVCKSWLSIISNPDFIKSHVHRSSKNPTLVTLLEPGQEPENPPPQQDLDNSIRFKNMVIPGVFDITQRRVGSRSLYRVYQEFTYLSTYNGIICLHSLEGQVIHLWNPSIRKFKKLPFIRRRRFMPKLGFGYDSISDDYKVVMISELNLVDHVSLVQVYSTNTDSWTEFQTRVLKLKQDVYNKLNTVVNGVLYMGNRNELISFDLHSQVVGVVSLPAGFSRQNWRSYIMDFQGSVAILFVSRPGIYELWTLECSTVPDQMSWTNKFSIQADPEIWFYCYLGAGQFWGGSTYNRTHFLYDYESKEIKYYGPLEPDSCATLKYSETLVSLNGFELVDSDVNNDNQ